MISDQKVIHDLQQRLSFQEDAIAHLNKSLAFQQQETSKLQIQMQHLYSKLRAFEGAMDQDGAQDNVPPPHY
jgi:uncharacterized coiled-coil protein SlyX